MGQSHSSTPPIHHNPHPTYLQQQNWKLLQKPQVNSQQFGNFTINQNCVTQEVLRVYTLTFTSLKMYERFKEEWMEWRALAHTNIVQGKYMAGDETKALTCDRFCGGFYVVRLYVENPLLTLNDIKDIPVAEGLYILLESLKGFQELFAIFGYFPLKQPMITINQQGKVKVWVNSDLSKNYPLTQNLTNILPQDLQYPDRFILQLISLIDHNTDYGQSVLTFGQYITSKLERQKLKGLGFSNCRRELLSYAEEVGVDLPDSLREIIDILFERSEQSSRQAWLERDEANGMYRRQYDNGELLCEDADFRSEQQERRANSNGLQHNMNNQQFAQPYLMESFQQYPSQNQQYPSPEYIQTFNQPTKKNSINNSVSQNPKLPMKGSTHSSPPQRHSQQHIKNASCGYEQVRAPQANQQGQQYVNQIRQYQQGVSQHQSLTSHPQSHHTANNSNSTLTNPYPPQPYLPNPYHSLIPFHNFQKQSTIREQPQQDSFYSYKNSKFQTSRQAKRGSHNFKTQKNYRNPHKHAFSSLSDSKLNFVQQSEYSPRQVVVKTDEANWGNGNNRSRERITSRQGTKRSAGSIQYNTLNETKEIDAEIALDLQNLILEMKH